MAHGKKGSDRAMIGACVLYCGHGGWFVADIISVGTACAVIAGGEVNGGNLIRGRLSEATHHISDFPRAGYWNAKKGVFVVPAAQVTILTDKNRSLYTRP